MFYAPRSIGLLLMHSKSAGSCSFMHRKQLEQQMYFADVTLVLRSEGMPEVVLRDLASKNNTRDA